jgi:hypothetical protein
MEPQMKDPDKAEITPDERSSEFLSVPIWQLIKQISDEIPEDAWDNVPVDLATNTNSYLYDKGH